MDKKDFPKIVTLCGSTRFYQYFLEHNLRETMAGHIVLGIGNYNCSDKHLGVTDQEKAMLDELHKRKIDMSDEILVLNVGGYIGESTRSEITYAEKNGKGIRYLNEYSCEKCGSPTNGLYFIGSAFLCNSCNDIYQARRNKIIKENGD